MSFEAQSKRKALAFKLNASTRASISMPTMEDFDGNESNLGDEYESWRNLKLPKITHTHIEGQTERINSTGNFILTKSWKSKLDIIGTKQYKYIRWLTISLTERSKSLIYKIQGCFKWVILK